MLTGAGGDFQKDSSQLVKNPTPLHPPSPASKSGQHGSAKVTREWGWGNAQTLARPRAREHRMGVRSISEWRVPKEKGNKGRAAIPARPTHHGESGRWVSRRVRVTGLSENCASCSAAPLL